MFIELAQRLDRNAWLRHLVFLLAACVTILMIGYHFGTFDQSIHIPFLRAYADPTLFPNDPYLEMRHLHYSYFWWLFIPFLRAGILEPAMFVIHIISTYLAFWSLWELSKTLFDDALAALLSVIFLIMPHLSFAGFPLFEFSLLNRTFVFPFMLLAINLFLKRRYLWAFALLGLMYNLHVISVHFVLAMLLFDCLLEWKRIGWRNIVRGMTVFIIAALPVLIWRFSDPLTITERHPEWFLTVALGILYNVFFMVGPLHIWLLTLSGVGGLLLFFIAHRHTPASPHHRSVLYFVLAVLLVLGVQIITAYWLPILIIIQSQIIRIGFWGVLFGYLFFANYLAHSYRERTYARSDWWLLALATFAAPLAIIPALIWLILRVRWAAWRPRIATGLLLVILALGYITAIAGYDVWRPGLHIYGPQSPWEDTQLWAKNSTPRDARFITPPQRWSFYETDWRVFSERSTVSTQSELLEMAFVPEYMAYWAPRFDAIAPGVRQQFSGDYFKDSAAVAQAYHALSDAALLDAAARYDATYIIIEKPHLRPWPIAYENAEFVIYDVSGLLP